MKQPSQGLASVIDDLQGIQIFMLIVGFGVGVILIIKGFRVVYTIVFLVLFLLIILSFYQVKFSYGTNKMETSFGCIPVDSMNFSSGIKVFSKKIGFEIVKQDDSMYIFTGYGPFGLDRGKVEEELLVLGHAPKWNMENAPRF